MSRKTFSELVNDNEQPVLVDFYATWCGPCQTLSPIVEDFARDMNNKVKVIKVDVDKNQAAAQKFNIRGVPTLILFKDGKMVWRKSGLLTKRDLISQVTEHL